jgi:type IV pilus assembly protein PilA
VQLDESKTITIPGEQPMVIPAVSLLLRIDGIAPGLEPLLGQLGSMLQRSEQDGRVLHTFGGELPIVGWQPVIAVEGEALYIVSSPEFFAKCLAKTDRLTKTPGYTKALTELGDQGNELAYVSPALFAKIRRIPELNPAMDAEQKRIFELAMRNLPAAETPIVSIRVNLPDGVLYRSLRDTSLKQELVLVAVYNPVTVGLMAAMAIPAFNKVQATSQDTTIENNLRQLSAAADQYYLETGKDTATFDDLVGPDKFIREELESVAGEDYREVQFKAGEPLIVHTPDGREFSVQP